MNSPSVSESGLAITSLIASSTSVETLGGSDAQFEDPGELPQGEATQLPSVSPSSIESISTETARPGSKGKEKLLTGSTPEASKSCTGSLTDRPLPMLAEACTVRSTASVGMA